MGHAPMTSKQDQQKRRELPRKQRRLIGTRASTPGRGMEIPTPPAGLDPVVAAVIEALPRTMPDNDNSKQHRLLHVTDPSPHAKFPNTNTSELLAHHPLPPYNN